MKANAVPLLTLLRETPQFTIPIWQRTYSWTERECGRLWEDILRAGSDDSIEAHFINSIVYVGPGTYVSAGHNPMLVIDGQQRLTTAMLVLEALARKIGDKDEPLDGFSARKIREWYLIVAQNSDDRRFRLVLTQTDKQTLFAILDGQPQPEDFSVRLTSNFDFFRRELQNITNLDVVCKGLAKLIVVGISLDPDPKRDNPQLIFESMNSTGLDLTQSDLIRNYILMGLSANDQNRLYKNHWRQMEILFGQKEWKRFDGFMRNYLTLKTRVIPTIDNVYESFKDAFRLHASSIEKVEELIIDIRKYAEYYCAIALEREKDDREFAHAFRDIRELKAEASFPFLLEMYDDYASGNLTKHDFLSAIRLVESYVFRRVVCDIPTNTHNATFATFGRSIQKDDYLNSIRQHFHSRHFPTDEKFKEFFVAREMFRLSGKRIDYCLRRLENHDSKEPVTIGKSGYTVEHILPQTPNLSEDWRDMLGSDWSVVREEYLHKIGNLTLTGYNSELGARPFNEKRDMEGGYKDSPLRLNRGLGTLERWDAGTIEQRGRELAERAVKVWPPLTTK